jgi:hypothetical protein
MTGEDNRHDILMSLTFNLRALQGHPDFSRAVAPQISPDAPVAMVRKQRVLR